MTTPESAPGTAPAPTGWIVLIANPNGGRGEVGRRLPEVEASLKRQGIGFKEALAPRPGDAMRIARRALEAGERFLVCVGGDDTVNEVVNGMLADDGPVNPEAKLAVLDGGSGCDFVRTFGLPEDVRRAVARLEAGTLYPIDAGKITYRDRRGEERVRYFANLSETGLGGAVTRRMERLPRFVGRARRFVAFWMSIAAYRRVKARVSTGGKDFDGRVANVVIANCQYHAGGVRISPRSFPGDSYLDVSIYKGPRSDSFTMLPKMFLSEHVPHPNIEEYKARRITVDGDRPLPIAADGIFLGYTPATFEVVHQAIRLHV